MFRSPSVRNRTNLARIENLPCGTHLPTVNIQHLRHHLRCSFQSTQSHKFLGQCPQSKHPRQRPELIPTVFLAGTATGIPLPPITSLLISLWSSSIQLHNPAPCISLLRRSNFRAWQSACCVSPVVRPERILSHM